MKDILFDARSNTDFNWLGVNDALEKENPDYFNQYGKVGSDQWWENKANGAFDTEVFEGRITFIGSDKDEFEEEWDILRAINKDSKEIEYPHYGYMKDPNVQIRATRKIWSTSSEQGPPPSLGF